MNKNISIWRGSQAPPTIHHVWIKEDNSIYLHNGTDWEITIDKDIYDKVQEFINHQGHFPQVKPMSDGISDLIDGEFQLNYIEEDTVIDTPKRYARQNNFVAKEGDLLLSGKINIKGTKSLNSQNPCLTSLISGKLVNIVFKNGDYELGVVNGEVKTILRQATPVWEIQNWQFKHIESGKYLQFNSSTKRYELGLSSDVFELYSINSSIRSFNLRRSGVNQGINMQSGSGYHYYISEWNLGDINNELFIIDSSLIAMPKLSISQYELVNYKIQFLNKNLFYSTTSSNSKVSSKGDSYAFVGTSYNDCQLYCNNKPVWFGGNSIYTSSSASRFALRPYGYESNLSFIISPQDNTSKAFNPTGGVTENNTINLYNRTDVNNQVKFISIDSPIEFQRIISTQCATETHDGLMSASDKVKLDNAKQKQQSKSSPSSSGTAISFIDTISQNEQGVISATKKQVQNVSTTQSGLMSNTDKLKLDGLKIVQLNTPSNNNSIASYELHDHNSTKLGATINIPKDTSIKDIQVADMNATINNAGEIIAGLPKGNTALCIVYILVNGTYKLVKLDYQSFLEEAEVSNGLQVNNNKVSVKIDPISESYLTVGPNGVKLAGVDQTVDRVSTIWEGNKELPKMEVVTNYTIKNQAGTKVTDTSTLSTLEYGYKVDISSNLRWLHNNTCKDPTSTSGDWGTVLPNSSQYITLTKSDIVSNTTFTQTIYADKTGLMVKGNSVVPAEGQDSESVSITINFKHRVYQGGTTTNNPTETIIKSLNSELSGKSKTITGITADNIQYYYYAYPKSLGELTKITQDGALSILSAFTKTELQITNDAGLSIDMLVYVSNNKGAFTNNTLKFE